MAVRYIDQFKDKRLLKALAGSFLLLILSLVVNYFASLYAMERASNSVTDIILSNIPIFEVDYIFVWGPIVFWAVLAVFLFREPGRIPFVLKNVALFVIIRSFFISLTHIGPFPDHVTLDAYGYNWIQDYFHTNPALSFIFSSGSDLFFSAHTGIPFLLALIFWKDRHLRTFCLASSVFFGIIVLLGHLHYSIDVASAFFITYAISHIGIRIFKDDERRFSSYSQKALETQPASRDII